MTETGRVMSFQAKPGGGGGCWCWGWGWGLDAEGTWSLGWGCRGVSVEEGFEEEVKVDIASSRSQLCAARISVQRSGSSKPVIAWKYANLSATSPIFLR